MLLLLLLLAGVPAVALGQEWVDTFSDGPRNELLGSENRLLDSLKREKYM